MVPNAINLTPWTKAELLKRFPSLLSGAEGEGGEGSGAPATPPSGDGPGATTTTTPPEGDGTPKVYDEAYVRTLREEAAARRVSEKAKDDRIAELEAAEAERKKAEMSDLDRAKAELEEERKLRSAADQSLVNERKRNAVISEAAKLKFRDPQDALAYIDMEAITMTENGQPHKTSIESAVKKIADEKKYLIEGVGSADGGTTGATPPTNAQRVQEIQNDITARGGVPVSI